MFNLQFLHFGQNIFFGHCFLRIKLRQSFVERHKFVSLFSFIPLNGTISDVFFQDEIVLYELCIILNL